MRKLSTVFRLFACAAICSPLFAAGNDAVVYTSQQIVAIFKNDIFGFYPDETAAYQTEQQKKTFARTEEFKTLAANLKAVAQALKTTRFSTRIMQAEGVSDSTRPELFLKEDRFILSEYNEDKKGADLFFMTAYYAAPKECVYASSNGGTIAMLDFEPFATKTIGNRVNTDEKKLECQYQIFLPVTIEQHKAMRDSGSDLAAEFRYSFSALANRSIEQGADSYDFTGFAVDNVSLTILDAASGAVHYEASIGKGGSIGKVAAAPSAKPAAKPAAKAGDAKKKK